MKIDLSKQPHQDNLKSEIFYQFRKRFMDCGFLLACEYRVENCRFDLVAYDESTSDIVGLIEVRRIGVRSEPKLGGRKHGKYSQYGCRVFYISEFDKISELLDELENCFSLLKNT